MSRTPTFQPRIAAADPDENRKHDNQTTDDQTTNVRIGHWNLPFSSVQRMMGVRERRKLSIPLSARCTIEYRSCSMFTGTASGHDFRPWTTFGARWGSACESYGSA